MSLTQEQLDILGFHALAGDRISYYEALASFGDGYGTLALDVVKNSSSAGALANSYFLRIAGEEGLSVSGDTLAKISLELMRADYFVRSANSGNADVDAIQQYHEDVFQSIAGVSIYGWTPDYYLRSFSDPVARQSAWDQMISKSLAGQNTSVYFDIADRRISYFDEYIATMQSPPFDDWSLMYDFTRQDLIDMGWDATFVDYMQGYQLYLTDLQGAGFTEAIFYDSNEYGPHSVAIPGQGEMIGGSEAHDDLVGTDGNDVLVGFDGSDVFYTSDGADRYHGLNGHDLVIYANETAGVLIEVGPQPDLAKYWDPLVAQGHTVEFVTDQGGARDTLVDIEGIVGSAFVDTVKINSLDGWDKISEIIGLGAAETADIAIDAFAGLSMETFLSFGDVIDLEGLTAVVTDPVSIVLGEGSNPDLTADFGAITIGGASIALADFSAVIGSANAEQITGNTYSNQFFAMDGDDTMIGGEATDWLIGGNGDDVLYGGMWEGLETPTAPILYEDDGVRDYLVGGLGYDYYYASAHDQITDAAYHAVDQAAADGTRFVAEGQGEIRFEGRLLTGGERIPEPEWDRYPPTPELNILIAKETSPGSGVFVYVQRELFVATDSALGPLYYRVMNAETPASDGTLVSEWLLIVEDPVAGTAITIAGVDYTPGQGIADGFLGLSTATQTQQLTVMALDPSASDPVPMGVLDAAALGDYLASLGQSGGLFPEGAAANPGLLGADVLETAPSRPSGQGSDAQPRLSSGTTDTSLAQDGTLQLAAAKAPGGGGGNGGGGNGGGGDPEPEPPETGTGFMGIGIVNPDPAPDTAGNDNIRGGKGNDTLIATEGNDTLKGAGGDDWLEGGWGADVLDGGSGSDTVSYASSNAGVQVQLFNGLGSGGHAQGDQLSSIEHVSGSGYSDILYGDAGDNLLIGLYGNDYFEGRGGNDTFDGGLGNDAVGYSWMSTGHVDVNIGTQSFGGVAAGVTYVSIESFGGTNNAAEGDILIGSDIRNDLYGYGGDDLLQGAGGGDLLNGGAGSDTVDGGDGNDNIAGGRDADILTGGAGYDLFTFSWGDSGTTAATWDVITDYDAFSDFLDLSGIDADETNGDWFSSPNDGFRWIGTDPFFSATPGDLRYEHIAGDTHLMGETDGDGQADFVIVLSGIHDLSEANFLGDSTTSTGSNQPIYGTEAGESIYGTDVTELFYALGGNDTVVTRGGNDTVYGGEGDDQVYGSGGNEVIHGEAGNEWIDAGFGNDTIYGGPGDDLIYGAQNSDLIYGGDGNDDLRGDLSLSTGQDTLYGDAGNDRLSGGGQIDYMDGGDGIDQVVLFTHFGFSATYGVVADLEADTASYTNGDVEVIINIEDVTGTNGDDTLYGDSGANAIDGYDGDDLLVGRGGDDLLTGDVGADVFAFATGDGFDTVTDFEDGIDLFDLSATGLGFGDIVISNVGADVEIAYGLDQITVLGGANVIDSSDFVFA